MSRMTPEEVRAAKAKASLRQAEALKLRSQGLTYEKIAIDLGFSSQTAARRAVSRAIKKVLKEPTEDVITFETIRLDKMLSVALAQAEGGNLKAIDTVLRIMERRANLLGLDAPKSFDLAPRIREIAQKLGMDPTEAEKELIEVIRANRSRTGSAG